MFERNFEPASETDEGGALLRAFGKWSIKIEIVFCGHRRVHGTLYVTEFRPSSPQTEVREERRVIPSTNVQFEEQLSGRAAPVQLPLKDNREEKTP